MVITRTGRTIAAIRGWSGLRRWALWLAFWLVLLVGCNMAAALA